MTRIAGRANYARRPAPAQYDSAWFAIEFQNVQQAIPALGWRTMAANGRVLVTDALILADATNGAFTATLEQASRVDGMQVTIKKVDASANAVTIGATVDGAVNPTLATQYKSMTITAANGLWLKVASV